MCSFSFHFLNMLSPVIVCLVYDLFPFVLIILLVLFLLLFKGQLHFLLCLYKLLLLTYMLLDLFLKFFSFTLSPLYHSWSFYFCFPDINASFNVCPLILRDSFVLSLFKTLLRKTKLFSKHIDISLETLICRTLSLQFHFERLNL